VRQRWCAAEHGHQVVRERRLRGGEYLRDVNSRTNLVTGGKRQICRGCLVHGAVTVFEISSGGLQTRGATNTRNSKHEESDPESDPKIMIHDRGYIAAPQVCHPSAKSSLKWVMTSGAASASSHNGFGGSAARFNAVPGSAHPGGAGLSSAKATAEHLSRLATSRVDCDHLPTTVAAHWSEQVERERACFLASRCSGASPVSPDRGSRIGGSASGFSSSENWEAANGVSTHFHRAGFERLPTTGSVQPAKYDMRTALGDGGSKWIWVVLKCFFFFFSVFARTIFSVLRETVFTRRSGIFRRASVSDRSDWRVVAFDRSNAELHSRNCKQSLALWQENVRPSSRVTGQETARPHLITSINLLSFPLFPSQDGKRTYNGGQF